MHHHTALLFPKNHYCFSVLSIIICPISSTLQE
uniref:Uncharacterized protein n=1 Tax=Anguilla anguilla TaxID=7936 RepID=A0A0E9TIW3_ANGAN